MKTESAVKDRYAAGARAQEPALCCPVSYDPKYLEVIPQEVIDRYKSLADIERGFRVLKSELEIGPVHHRLPERIRAHAAICFMALILYRVMRMRLRASESSPSPERALEVLRRVQKHQIRLDNATDPVTGISTMTLEQTDLFKALKIKKPLSAQA